MKSFYLLLVAAVLGFTSCRTKEGEPGPAGQSTLNKQGFISGTIIYTNDKGHDTTMTFKYEYFGSLSDNTFSYIDFGQGAYYELYFQRRDLKEPNNYFSFDLNGSSSGGIEDVPNSTNIDFYLLTVINNELHEVSNEDIVITDISIDPATGRAMLSFAGTVNFDNDEAAITGTADVTLNRLSSNILK